MKASETNDGARGSGDPPLRTPDGRYIVVRGRLWRTSDPSLTETERSALVSELSAARRAVATARRTDDSDGEAAAHAAVDHAKRALGERGAVWWSDGAPDHNRRMARNTPYADWFESVQQGGDDTPRVRAKLR